MDLGSGKTLYELNPDRFFVPASNTKLFTTALALTRLGPDFTFQTRVVADSPPDAEGRIRGALRLVGGGDPNLSARAIPYRMGPVTGNPLAAIEDLADQVAARGVKRIDGGIVGDDTWYLWQPFAEGWAIDDPQYDYGAPVSALTVNDNAVTLAVRPGAREGDLAALAWNPPLEYYRVDNRIRTVAAGGERSIHFHRDPGSLAGAAVGIRFRCAIAARTWCWPSKIRPCTPPRPCARRWKSAGSRSAAALRRCTPFPTRHRTSPRRPRRRPPFRASNWRGGFRRR